MLSIVIPVYNAKASLERCVDSWLCQTRKDLEIILVDDGSSDGSKELCDELAKNHLVRVATSDGPEQMIIVGNGALRLSASAFEKEIEAVERSIEEYLSNS